MWVVEERLPGRGHRPRLTEPSARVGGDVELHALGDADPAGVACGRKRKRLVHPLLRLELCCKAVFMSRAGAYSRVQLNAIA